MGTVVVVVVEVVVVDVVVAGRVVVVVVGIDAETKVLAKVVLVGVVVKEGTVNGGRVEIGFETTDKVVLVNLIAFIVLLAVFAENFPDFAIASLIVHDPSLGPMVRTEPFNEHAPDTDQLFLPVEFVDASVETFTVVPMLIE